LLLGTVVGLGLRTGVALTGEGYSDVGEEETRTELDLYISSSSKIILSSGRDKRSTYRSIKCFVADGKKACLSDGDQIRLVVYSGDLMIDCELVDP